MIPNGQNNNDSKRPPLASPDTDDVHHAGVILAKQQEANLDISTTSLGGESHGVGAIVCRICYSTCGTMYAFCKCKGSVGYVHKDCLKRWIGTKLKANKCEICQSPFYGSEWSFKPIRKWVSPKMNFIDKLYVALFICCTVIVMYSIPWITYKTWRSREAIFGSGPVTSERIFAIIVIAIYVPLNISCIASLVVLWRRAIYVVFRRFIDANKMWRVKVTREVAETKLINAINSTNKEDDDNIADARPAKADETLLLSSQGETSGDSTTMLISRSRDDGHVVSIPCPEDVEAGTHSHGVKLTTEV